MNSGDAERDESAGHAAHAPSRRKVLAWLGAAGASAILGSNSAVAGNWGGTLPKRTLLSVEGSALLEQTSLNQSWSPQSQVPSQRQMVLDPADFRYHIDYFNAMAPEEVVSYVPNAAAWDWMQANIPFFACPDGDVEQIYYYRWWAYRKHIEKTPVGFIITEFLKPVKHAGEYNALSCAFGHHVAEGRWLHDPQYIDQHINFWLHSGPNGGLHPKLHQFSGWTSAAVYDRWLVNGDRDFLLSQLDALILDYKTWEQERLLPSGLFWQFDVADGMESSISGGRKVHNARPTINSYMFGNAKAIAAIATLQGKPDVAQEYEIKAARLRQLVNEHLWNSRDLFFEALFESGKLAGVREEIGFTPWLFGVPHDGTEYAAAWRQLADANGFFAPYGPTTAEQRNSGFQIAFNGDDCQWNGPSWPFSTTITLKALGNFLNTTRASNFHQAISPQDYFRTFLLYTRSHRLRLDDGRVIPWVDENLDPFTGNWLARERKIKEGVFYGRGDHYNHSAYADLVITDVAGLRPRADATVEVHPLLPANTWDWFCLDGVPYHGHLLTIVWDETGKKFGKEQGLSVLADGKLIAHAAKLGRVAGLLPSS
ncbi:MAG: glycosyl hydrolase family 65 protein [Candidatus Acidiferrales bacterium]